MSKTCDYAYDSTDESHMHRYFVPPILRRLEGRGRLKILDLGCGNGALCKRLAEAGHDVTGVDVSGPGIGVAKKAYPHIRFEALGVYDEPPADFMVSFDVVVSTEVVEHLYAPRALPKLIHQVLKPGGQAIVTTPYHGYLKNLAICLMNKWDRHHDVFWDHGHIKFWSKATLTKLFEDEGFAMDSFEGLGRFPYLWMTMLMSFQKPK
jgi:2-polyprenyl-3-methyl-5-hydroxy-6-metoxy-1,4-benzoquinol methylase